jgi:hypothetical protein
MFCDISSRTIELRSIYDARLDDKEIQARMRLRERILQTTG